MRRRPSSRGILFSVVCAALTVPTAAGAEPASPRPSFGTAKAPRRNPLASLRLFVDPASTARRQADRWAGSRPSEAALLERIAQAPQADWFGDWSRDVRAAVALRTREIRRAGAVPLYVAYNIPFRDCGSHSAGGAASAEAYRGWIRDFSAGLGRGPAIVILEPDAVAGADCLSAERRAERYALLAETVRMLKSRPGTTVYLDGGHARWHGAREAAARLRRAGVEAADGFSLNVSNTVATERSVRYGQEVSRLLGGAGFVIDTSRNGLGAAADGAWCNPSETALGHAPTTTTGRTGVDAFLWIKRPGESDGRCNGGPGAGQWWPEYAVELARRSPVA